MELQLQPSSRLFFILSKREECNYQGEIDMLQDQDYTWNNKARIKFNFQIDQIINNFTYECPLPIKNQTTPQIQTLQRRNSENLRISPSGSDSNKKQKKNQKIKKTENSPFHNYQKHLNNALKKLIIVPQFEAHCQQYKLVAKQIWSIYCRCNIKTKRILHYIFNQKNQHSINEPQLKTYRLANVYRTYPTDVLSSAKTYLSKLAIDQLDEQNLEGYLKTRKLKKNRAGFKEYILGFKGQLQTGYLKRRVNGEKIQSDQ